MPEIEPLAEEMMPPALKELFTRARRKDLTPEDFYKELGGHGITGFVKVLYTCRAFDLPLNQVKQFYIIEGHGSIDDWAGKIQVAIDEIKDPEP
jgi:hypothetical protein